MAVTSNAPVLNSTGVGTNVKVIAVFNQAMNSDTLNDKSFKLVGESGSDIPGTVTYNSTTQSVSFAAASGNGLSANTKYTAKITKAARNMANKSLLKDYVWTFITGESADISDLTVVSSSPVNFASGVVLNSKVSVVFNKAIDPETVTSANFALTVGGSPVIGSLDYPNPTTIVFTPSNNLVKAETYKFTLNAGITDLAGIALTASDITFETGSELSVNSTAVDLGTAAEYAILAKSAVSVTGSAEIIGDVAVSPAARTFLTGFSDTIDADGAFSTSVLVTGHLFAANMAGPTPTNLTTAVADMQLAYTDAAGRSNPDHTELGAGNITGMDLAPGLYKWGTGLLITSDVTLTGSATDVWIFQIAQDLTIGNGVKVTLAGGALPKNIFWQVAGAVTMGTTSEVKGNILSQTRIEMQTGAKLDGRALAQTAVTIDANAVTKPAQ